ncbi:MAG TPA: zinc-ribbon domain-containing protein [Coriobacteriia bacterium]
MDCEKCGAEVTEGAQTCPECGEPVQAPVAEAATDTFGFAASAAVPEEDAGSEADDAFLDDVEPAAPAPAAEPVTAAPVIVAPEPGGKKGLLIAIVALIVIALAAGGWFAYTKLAAAASPESVAVKMLEGYAAYDAQAILNTATHDSLPADGVKEFETQAAEAKTRANGKPGVKSIKVSSVKMDNADQATVVISAEWLTDPAKGTYEKRDETLTVIKKDGKWLVKLF